jgi:hypothetical protein
MSEEKEVQKRPAREPIKIECPIEGHEEDFILFIGSGWKFKHLRKWEATARVEDLTEVILERIVDWRITDPETGELVPFDRERGVEVMDDLDPAQAAWATTAYRMAYSEAGLPNPNLS